MIVPACSPSTGFDRKVSNVSCNQIMKPTARSCARSETGTIRVGHVLGQRPAQSGVGHVLGPTGRFRTQETDTIMTYDRTGVFAEYGI